jgi:hypothetical protein
MHRAERNNRTPVLGLVSLRPGSQMAESTPLTCQTHDATSAQTARVQQAPYIYGALRTCQMNGCNGIALSTPGAPDKSRLLISQARIALVLRNQLGDTRRRAGVIPPAHHQGSVK